MQTNQVSIWVPIIVGLIGLLGIIAGQLVNAWREDRRWARELAREDVRWQREAEKEAAKRAQESQIDWRKQRLATYGEYLGSVRRLIEITEEATSYRVDTEQKIWPLREKYWSEGKITKGVEQNVRLIASDDTRLFIDHSTTLLSWPLLFPSVPHAPSFNPTPEKLRQQAEADQAHLKELKDKIADLEGRLSDYYLDLVGHMRVDLGTDLLPMTPMPDDPTRLPQVPK